MQIAQYFMPVPFKTLASIIISILNNKLRIMWVIVISILIIIVTLSFLCYLQRVWHFKNLKDVSKIFMWQLPIIMDAIKVRNSRQMIEFLLNTSKKEAKRYKISLGFDNYLFLLRSEDIKIVLNSQELLSKGKDYKLMERLIGQSLITSTGKKWAQRKKMLTPTFNLSILRDFVPTFEAIGDVLIEVLEEKSNGNPIDVVKIFELFTLDVFYETSLGTSINAQRNENNEYVVTISKIMDEFIGSRLSWWKRLEFLHKISSDYKKFCSLCDWVINHTYEMIEERRQIINNLNKETIDGEVVGKKLVFLDMLLRTTIDGVHLSNEEVREEVEVFMIAGRDTTATTLSFALYCLAQHPKVQEKLFREQREIFAEKSKDAHATFNDLQQMNYLEMVIKEVLRLYSPSVLIFREAKTNITMEFGTMKKGLQIMLSPMATHRNPAYFPEPENFDPERFSPKNLDKIKPFTYIPFSHGYRNCIGYNFAMISLKSALSKIVRNFKFHPDITYKPILVFEVILRSKNGVWVIIEKRV